jgi:hypothetical protein
MEIMGRLGCNFKESGNKGVVTLSRSRNSESEVRVSCAKEVRIPAKVQNNDINTIL